MKEEKEVNIIERIITSIFMPMKAQQHSIALLISLIFYFFLLYFYNNYTQLGNVVNTKFWAFVPTLFFYKLFEYGFHKKMVLKGALIKGSYAFFIFVLFIGIVIILGFIAPLFWMK